MTVDRSTSSGHELSIIGVVTRNKIQLKLRQIDLLLHGNVMFHSSEQSERRTDVFLCPVGKGSRRLCGRRRKPRLEPDVRSSRFVIVREIPDATPFRVATFTRTTLPIHKMPNATPIGLFPTGTLVRKKEVRLSINWQMSVHTQLLTHRTDRTFTERQPLHIGYRLWCVSCLRIHLLQKIRLLMLPIPLQGFRNFMQHISVCLEVSVFVNQEAGGSGSITLVASSENSFTSTSSSTASPWSDNTSKDRKSMVPNGTFCHVCVSSSTQFSTQSPLGADFGGRCLLRKRVGCRRRFLMIMTRKCERF